MLKLILLAAIVIAIGAILIVIGVIMFAVGLTPEESERERLQEAIDKRFESLEKEQQARSSS